MTNSDYSTTEFTRQLRQRRELMEAAGKRNTPISPEELEDLCNAFEFAALAARDMPRRVPESAMA